MPTLMLTAIARPCLALMCLGAAAFAAPLVASAQMTTAPMAAPTTQPMTQPAPHLRATTHHIAYGMASETLDQRISSMHAALKITPAEEADWMKVVDVMRRNESDMQKMVADRKAEGSQNLNAVDDLKTYQSFSQAHVDGLKDLVASFETLYADMPADQKLVADHVFAKYGRERTAMRHAMQAHS